MKKEAYVIKFRVNFFIPEIEETVYMTPEEFEKLPTENPYCGIKDYEYIRDEYFTKDKIDKYKKELCDKIMSDDNPFLLTAATPCYYPVEEEKIWK